MISWFSKGRYQDLCICTSWSLKETYIAYDSSMIKLLTALHVIINCNMLHARRNEKRIKETKIWYLESEQKALLKFNKKIIKIKKLSFTKAMENIHTIKECLIYSILYVQTVPQNIYQYKSCSSFWSPDFKVKSKWTLSLNPKLNNPK